MLLLNTFLFITLLLRTLFRINVLLLNTKKIYQLKYFSIRAGQYILASQAR